MGAPSSQGNFKDETLNANGTGNSRSIVSEINLGQFLFFLKYTQKLRCAKKKKKKRKEKPADISAC